MIDSDATSRRKRRPSKPLDRRRLEDLALSYVARFATSSGKLRDYLRRKVRERGVVEGEIVDVEGLVAKFVDRKYVDDESYSRAKASDLAARGFGARRVEQTLRAAGVDDDIRARVEPGEAERREAVVRLARRRGFGPFARENGLPDPDRALKDREKRLAAILRAGHDFDAARRIVDARTIEELEEWVAEAQDLNG